MEVKPGYKRTEIGVIPEDWETKTYGEVFEFLRTANYSRNDLKEYGEIGYIHYGDIHAKFDGYIDLTKSSLPCIQSDQLKNYALVRTGDLIMVDASEDYTGIGKSIEAINNGNIKVIAGLHTFLMRDSDKVFVNGFRAYIHSIESVKKQFDVLATGMKVFGVNKNNLQKVITPVPTKAEQIAITQTLTDIDSLITSLEKLIEKKKLIKQGVMQQLLTGKRRLPGFNAEWETKRYGEIFQFLINANYARRELIDNGNIKYIHYGDIHTRFDNYVDLSNTSIPTIQESMLKHYPLLESGDVIMVDASEDYPGVGKSVEVINPGMVKAISGLHTIQLRDTTRVFVDGYRAFLHTIPSVKAQLDFYTTGMKIYSISKFSLAKIEIPVPPKAEQEAIVSVIRCLMDELIALEIRLNKSKLLKQAMMQELLTGRIRLI